jgi:hypothetical protein
MRPTSSSGTIPATRRTWKPPTVAKLAIGTQTKSARANGHPKFAHPEPPATPGMKLGFAFEWSLPLSARTSE